MRPAASVQRVSAGIGPAAAARVRLRVDLTLYVDVVDPAALTAAAVASVDRTQFHAEDGESAEVVQARERVAVQQDPAAALSFLLDPAAAADGAAGTEVDYAEVSVTPAVEPRSAPPFAELFEPDPDPVGWWLTPRTAALLHQELSLLADQAYDDVETLGEEPIGREAAASLLVLGRLPEITWRQGAGWHREMARAFDDLAGDLAAGRAPLPRCHGEEVALHLGLREAVEALRDIDELDDLVADLPAHPQDYDWSLYEEVLFQDHDVLLLYERDVDGIEDPDDDLNRASGIGDLRPSAWFRTFDNAEPRDPSRGVRR